MTKARPKPNALIPKSITTTLFALLLTACASAPRDEPPPTERDYIELSRGPCFGACPVYRVTVSGDGRVVFVGERFVERTGEHTKAIDAHAAAALFLRADSIGFFELSEDITPANVRACGQSWTDMPSAEVTIQWRDRHHTVRHYHGCPKAPPELTELERRIDDVLGTADWVAEQ